MILTEEQLINITLELLTAIHSGDLETYSRLCSPELTAYETDVAPYRIDGIDFHLDLMRSVTASNGFANLVRFDMLTPKVQIYGDCAVVTYTRLMTYNRDGIPFWKAFNETRVFVVVEEALKMVHFHRSDAPV